MPPKKGEKDEDKNGDETENKQDLLLILDEEPDTVSISAKKVRKFRILKYLRIFLLFFIWCIFTVLILVTKEGEKKQKGVSVPTSSEGVKFPIVGMSDQNDLTLNLTGPFLFKQTDLFEKDALSQVLIDNTNPNLIVKVTNNHEGNNGKEVTVSAVKKDWKLKLANSKGFDNLTVFSRHKTVKLIDDIKGGNTAFHFTLENVDEPLPLLVETYPGGVNTTTSMVLTVLIVIGWLMFLFWDVTSRAIIGLIFCTLAVALMGIYHIRPILREIPQFVDIDFALLLFGLTFIAGVFGETGGDRYLAVKVIRYSKGHVWPMLTVFCFVTAFTAAFLDQLTTLVLITLFAIRICELEQLNPSNFITCLIIFSNIGYMLTPVGVVGKHVQLVLAKEKDSYGMYMAKMIIPVMISMVVSYIFLRLYYRSTKAMQNIEPPIVIRLKHAIRFWNRTAKALGDYSEAEKAVQQSVQLKVTRLRDRLRRLGKMPAPIGNFDDTLKRLEEKHTIKHRSMFITVVVILIVIILVQIAYGLKGHHLSNGWTCLLFALILLALANCHDFESLMTKIDWSTLLLIVCTMIITKAVSPLGLLDELSTVANKRIIKIEGESCIYYAITLYMSISAFFSAFFDTSYVCSKLSEKVMELVNASKNTLPMQPLLLSVILGAGLGSNFTLISAFSNIVCAGLAEKHEYKFYFWDFFKVGATVTVLNLIFAIAYVFVYHVTVY